MHSFPPGWPNRLVWGIPPAAYQIRSRPKHLTAGLRSWGLGGPRRSFVLNTSFVSTCTQDSASFGTKPVHCAWQRQFFKQWGLEVVGPPVFMAWVCSCIRTVKLASSPWFLWEAHERKSHLFSHILQNPRIVHVPLQMVLLPKGGFVFDRISPNVSSFLGCQFFFGCRSGEGTLPRVRQGEAKRKLASPLVGAQLLRHPI